MLIIGLMSGTSADGVDAALVDLTDQGADQPPLFTLIAFETYPYNIELRTEILDCFRPESAGADRLAALNTALGIAFADAVIALCDKVGVARDTVKYIGSHGQTIWYKPPDPNGSQADDQPGHLLTLGEPALIAERTGITTLSHFRESDMAVGGRGAPLVSLLDWLYFRHPTHGRAIQNIGGIGNVTYLPPLNSLNSSAVPVSFDTGPGNMLIDALIATLTNGARQYDAGGSMAAQGAIDSDLLAWLLKHPYFDLLPPKTTGRELFGVQFSHEVLKQAQHLPPETIIATVTAFTAHSIARGYRDFLPDTGDGKVQEVYIAGGGARNDTLLAMLAEALPPSVSVQTHDALGLSGAAKEAVLFALLAFLTVHGRPGALPIFTGAKRAKILGRMTFA